MGCSRNRSTTGTPVAGWYWRVRSEPGRLQCSEGLLNFAILEIDDEIHVARSAKMAMEHNGESTHQHIAGSSLVQSSEDGLERNHASEYTRASRCRTAPAFHAVSDRPLAYRFLDNWSRLTVCAADSSPAGFRCSRYYSRAPSSRLVRGARGPARQCCSRFTSGLCPTTLLTRSVLTRPLRQRPRPIGNRPGAQLDVR